MSPSISSEEWEDEKLVPLRYRQMYALVIAIQSMLGEPANEAPNIEELLLESKLAIWRELKPVLTEEEIKEIGIDSDSGN